MTVKGNDGGDEAPEGRDLLELRERVRYILTEALGSVEVDRDGDFSFPYESTRVFIGVRPFGSDGSVIVIDAPLVFGATAGPELYEWVALHANDYVLGHLGCELRDDGALVLFSHRLLGDFMDPQELMQAVAAVAGTANRLDEEVMVLFGGERFAD